MAKTIPYLEPCCFSWVVVNSRDEVLLETWRPETAQALLDNGWRVFTASAWEARNFVRQEA